MQDEILDIPITTQRRMILKHLKMGKTITQLEALKQYGCMRLSARIWDLKDLGVNIGKNMVKRNGKRFAKYYLIENGVIDGRCITTNNC